MNSFTNAINASYNFLFHPINSAPVNASGASKMLRTIGALAIGIFSLGGAYLAVGIISYALKYRSEMSPHQAKTADRINKLVGQGAVLVKGLYLGEIQLPDRTNEDRVKAILDQVKTVSDQVNNSQKAESFGHWIDMKLNHINTLASQLAHSEKLLLYMGLYELLNTPKKYEKKASDNTSTITWIQSRLIESLINCINKGHDQSIIKPRPETSHEKLLQDPLVSDETKKKHTAFINLSDPAQILELLNDSEYVNEVTTWNQKQLKIAIENDIEELKKVLTFISGDQVKAWVESKKSEIRTTQPFIRGQTTQNESEWTKKTIASLEIASLQKKLNEYIEHLQHPFPS